MTLEFYNIFSYFTIIVIDLIQFKVCRALDRILENFVILKINIDKNSKAFRL